MEGHELHDSMDTLDDSVDSQMPHSADTEYLHTACTIIVFCMRKFQDNHKNDRGLFWELENRIMGRKKGILY